MSRVQCVSPLCNVFGRHARSAFLIVVVATFSINWQFGAWAQGRGANRLELPRHAIESPLSYENTLGEWQFAGAAVPAKDTVVLSPGVANRTGIIWHKTPLQTNNYELEFEFMIQGTQEGSASPGFSFWYTPNLSALKASAAGEAVNPSWTLFGFDPNFVGYAVFFAQFDRDARDQTKSSISFAQNDGSKSPIDPFGGVPTGDGIYFSPIRNTDGPLVFRLTVTPTEIDGYLRLTSSTSWSNCFSVPKVDFSPGGHIGFSAHAPLESAKKFDVISINNLHVFNMDVSQLGEDPPHNSKLAPSQVPYPPAEVLAQLALPPAEDPAEEIRRLSRILIQQMTDQAARDDGLILQLTVISRMMEQLVGSNQELQKQLAAATGVDGPKAEFANQVNNELQGLRNLFNSHSRNQENLQQSLIHIHKAIGKPTDLSEFAERSAALEATIKQQATFSSWMIFGVIIMIAMFALFMWKRMRDMEKKHFL